MPTNLTPRDRLRAAGLDLDLPLGGQTAPEARFCPYTGRELRLVSEHLGTADEARLGQDSFTQRGRLVRYTPGGGGAVVVDDPCAVGHLRQSVDLVASSALPLPEQSVLRSVDGTPTERLQMVAPGMGTVQSVVVRHGRLYALITTRSQQHMIQAWRLPEGRAAEGWRAARVRGALLPPAGHRPGGELRVSETLLYLPFTDHLGAWHAGTGEHLVEWAWPPLGDVVLARLAFDRLLLVREEGAAQIGEVYDLAQVAAGPCRPLPNQTVRLAEVPGAGAQPLWAEACGERFVVLASDGRVWVLPFDGEPVEVYANTEDVRLGPPSFRADQSGTWLASFAANDRGRWLLEVPLDPGPMYRFLALHDQPLASYDLAPCFVANRLVNVQAAADEIVQIVRCEPDTATAYDAQQSVPGTQGARLFSLQHAICRGLDLIHVEYGQGTCQHWFADADLQRLIVEPPFQQARPSSEARLLWDAAGLYLCNLTEGVAYARSPQP